MLPTRSGIVTAVVGAVLYALAWQTHIGWFYLADVLVWASLLVNLLLPWLNLRGLSAQRWVLRRSGGQSSGIFEDDSIGLAIELRNRSPLPKLFFTLQERCPLAIPGEEEQGFLIGGLAPRSRITVTYNLRCYRRGVYAFPSLQVQTAAPFGLFRARRRIEAPLEVTVYPQVLPMGQISPRGSWEGDAPRSRPLRSGGEFRGSRDYQQGDYFRHIHWRSSARRGQWMVKEFDETPLGGIRVAFNPALSLGEGRESTLEYAIKIAASLAQRCFQEGRPFLMGPPGGESPFATWRDALEHLARLGSGASARGKQKLGQSASPETFVLAVSAADRETLQLLQRLRPVPDNTIVVLLAGFAPEKELLGTEGLALREMVVVRCQPGTLPAALAALRGAMTRRDRGWEREGAPSRRAREQPSR